MLSAAVIGCAGYAGQETLDRVLAHPELDPIALGSDSLAGQPAAALDVRLNGSLPRFVPNEEALSSGADVVFWCLEHREAAALEPPADAVVVDLTGAHRLRDAALYAEWYGFEHPAPASLADWSGVAPELSRVQATDAAEVGLFLDRSTGRAVVICAIDNLGKGAAGQAIQNANLALGLDETLGLRLSGVLV